MSFPLELKTTFFSRLLGVNSVSGETLDWPGVQDTPVLGVRILWIHSSVWGDRTPLAKTKSD